MSAKWLAVLALCSASNAMAQESGLSISVGARAWYSEWTTFSYLTDDANQNIALTQVSADEELAFMPIVSVRYRNFVGSISGFPSTDYARADGAVGERKELDVNLGYYVMPGLAFTVGYKEVEQSGNGNRYRPAGPVVGMIGNAPLGGAWSLYGSLGLGKLDTPSGDSVQFEADYRLTEIGVAYSLDARMPRRWTFTAGYRIQVMSSKEAFGSQDGRDTTEGFTLGALATF